MNTVYKLAKPVVQNPGGKFPLPYPAVAEVVHSCPPFAHSHIIFSFLSHGKVPMSAGPYHKISKRFTPSEVPRS